MKKVEMDEATASLSEYAGQLVHEPVVVTVDGTPVAALVPIENADLETVSLSTSSTFLALVERSRVRHTSEGGVSTEQMRRRLDTKQSEE